MIERNYEKEEKIKWLYDKVRYKLEKLIILYLKKQNIFPKGEVYDISPNFSDLKKWRISTISQKDYTSKGSSLEKEDIKSIKGSFYITKRTLKIHPPFDFEFEVQNSNFSFNPSELKKIIKEDKEREEWSVEALANEAQAFNVVDKKKDKLAKNLSETASPLLEGIGFSKDESQMMVLGALSHEKFTPGMAPEDVVGLALRIRGENLTKDN